MKGGHVLLWALCLAIGVLPCQQVLADPVGDWALVILRQARTAAPFVALDRQAEAAAASVNAGLELPPWLLEVSSSHTEYATAPTANAGGLDSLTSFEAKTAKYLGYGADVGTTVDVSRSGYAKVPGLPASAAQGMQIDLSLSMDFWRDRFGRFTQAQREAAALAIKASISDVSATAEVRALNVLSTAMDLCALADQQREALVTADVVAQLLSETEMRAKAKVISEGELLQFESLMLSLQQSLEQLSQNQEATARDLEVNYGVVVRAADCPALKLPPAEASSAAKNAPGAVASGTPTPDATFPDIRAAELRIEAQQRGLSVAELSMEPTLKPFVSATGSRFGRGFDSAASGIFKNYRNWGGTVGVNLEWNFGTSQLEYAQQAAALGLSAARLGLDELRSSISAQMDQIKIQMRSIRGLVELLARQRALSTEYLETEKLRFAVGRSSAFQLTSAYQGYQGVVSLMPNLIAQWYKAGWKMDSLRGRLLAPVKEDVRGSADSAR